ncbi:hypothetical protein [Streptomyces luteolus]|uniref:Uncharacterized protein n=1 Tax=Streptomyces luteolus TaxID=3043615 RepID=A0ABT6SR03_9ACTN|nr:hypothetical protein [Streptomyces sp. B-S-A12]MDI3417826.1 hypothetical protein [Streptomyces sp. B-S-A12]
MRNSRSKGKRGGRAESGERDVEELLDELYVTPPPDFVARRGELAAEAKADGRPEGARGIRAARRPTLAAWAANLLLRSEPADCERFLALGQALREAYRSLDADEIKQLSGRRNSVVAAMPRQAVSLAREAGHPLSDGAQQDVVSTLRAVLADQESADRWAAGRLESALTPPSDFSSSGATGPSGTSGAAARREQRTRKSARSTPGAAPVRDELAERRRRREQEQLAAARKAAEDAAAEADQALERQRADVQDADAALEQARDRRTRAREQVSEAERQLEAAREGLERAERAQRDAEERARASADAAARAERDAQRAAAEVERLRE